jgi:hypothetical protein
MNGLMLTNLRVGTIYTRSVERGFNEEWVDAQLLRGMRRRTAAATH